MLYLNVSPQLVDNISVKTVAGSQDKLETTHSTLTIPLTNHQAENGAVYRCDASNDAVFGDPMTATVDLDILCKSQTEPPENCHLTVKKLPKTLLFFSKKLPKIFIYCNK